MRGRFRRWYQGLNDAFKEDLIRITIAGRPRGRKLQDIVHIPKGAKGFDIDVVEADVELMIKNLLTDLDKIEVKDDFKVSETSNVAIEFECRGHPSGIATTEASHWFIMLDGMRYRKQVGILIETERLYEIARRCPIALGGDDQASRMYLVPVTRLLTPFSVN